MTKTLRVRHLVTALTLTAAIAAAAPLAASVSAAPSAKTHAVATQIKWGLSY
ncbi:hypothetical protein [Streptacidiphilus sp. EB129]|uniref:hypothetical protein n=1 Tax=Streptacidiphilus sp. EB129 TaxID=3156262 RepID=UPI0035145DBF